MMTEQDYLVDDIYTLLSDNEDVLASALGVSNCSLFTDAESITITYELEHQDRNIAIRLTEDGITATDEEYIYDQYKDPVPGYVLGDEIDITSDFKEALGMEFIKLDDMRKAYFDIR